MRVLNETVNTKIKYSIVFLCLVAGLITSSLFKFQNIFILIFLVSCLSFVIAAPRYFLLLYFMFLSVNDFYVKEDFLFSVLGLKQILGIVMLMFYFHHKTFINDTLRHHPYSRDVWSVLKPISSLLILIPVYWIYTYFKNFYFDMHDFDLNLTLTKSVNMILIYYSIVPFLKTMIVFLQRSTVEAFFIFSVLFMLIFTFLSPYLPALGVKSVGTIQTEFESDAFQRYTGIILNGDSNTLGIFFVMCVAMLMILHDSINKLLLYSILTMCVIAIGLSGSRTALISLSVAIFVFLFLTRRNFKFKALILFFAPILFIIALPYFEMVIERLTLANQQLDTRTDANRIGKWILYWEFFISNPVTFITGAQKELRIAWNDTYYTAHNVFITVIYNAGIVFSLAFLYKVGKSVVVFSRKNLIKEYAMLFVPFFFLLMTVSDLGIVCSYSAFVFLFYASKKNTGAPNVKLHSKKRAPSALGVARA